MRGMGREREGWGGKKGDRGERDGVWFWYVECLRGYVMLCRVNVSVRLV